MKLIILFTLSLLFSGCSQKAPEPKLEYIECEYPRLKTLHAVKPYTPKYTLKDGIITMYASELHNASMVSLSREKQNSFYRKQIGEYNLRFVK